MIAANVEVAAGAPCRLEHFRQQNVLAAVDGVGVDAHQREQARGGGLHAIAEGVGVVEHSRGRRGERLEHRERQAGAGARRVDRAIDGLFEPADALAVFAPFGEALAPRRRPFARRARRASARRGRRRCRRSTGGSRSGRSSGKVSSRLPRSPLGSMAMAGMPSRAASSKQREAEAGLAAAGHADADGVGGEVGAVVEQRLVGRLPRGEVVPAAEVERAALVDVGHGHVF